MNKQKQSGNKSDSFILGLTLFWVITNLVFPSQLVFAAPTNWYVTTIGDDLNSCMTVASPCLTINSAIGKAIDGDTIYVATGTYTSTDTEVVLINKSITLSGGWDNTFTTQIDRSIIDGQGVRRGITVPLGITATTDTLTVQNGYHDNQGGGIRNNGTLSINNSIIKNNVSHWMGGGIFTYGMLTINDTIIDGNSAGQIGYSGGGGGGAIQNYSGTTTINNSTISNNIILGWFHGGAINSFNTLILNNSTVSSNTNMDSIYTTGGSMTFNNTTISSNSGTAIAMENGSLFLNNSTVSHNLSGINNSPSYLGKVTLANSIVANNTSYDCYGSISSAGYNLIGIGNTSGCTFSAATGDLVGTNLAPIDPLLGPLQDNGGSTFTHNLLWGSPAMDSGNPAAPGSGGNACLAIDQRGVIRPIDDNVVLGAVCDIGAVEFNDNTPQVAILPTSYNAEEQIPLDLHNTGISVGDINNDPLTLTITTTDANSQIFADAGGTSAVVFSGNGTNSLVLTGSVTQLNNLLAGNLGSTFTYIINDDTPAADATLIITADDGNATESNTALINITAINDAPVNTVPSAQIANEDTALIFSAGNGNQISVNDVDAGSDSLEITLAVTNGTLTLAGTTGLSFTTGDGTSDATMVFQGTLIDINNALAMLSFYPISNYYGNAILTLSTNDLGNTGVGGALTDSGTVKITVNSINDPPVVINPIPDQHAAENQAFSYQFPANTFSDPDIGNTLVYSAQLAGGGTLPTWLSFNAVTQTFSGTPSNANVGTVSIDVIADDGNGGTALDTFNMTVNSTVSTPTDINLSNNNVNENLPSGTAVGILSTTDADIGDTFIYSFCGGIDDKSFSITGNILRTAAVFDYETKTNYSICVRSTDSGSLNTTKTFVIHINDLVDTQTFADVPTSYWAWQFIETLYDTGLTGGCEIGPLIYCPDISVTRAQMAIFLEKGLHYPATYSPPNIAPTFSDAIDHWAEDWIEALRVDGITSGCTPYLYCPENPVTRAQMAVFLLKTKHGVSYTPPPATGLFQDVPVGYWADKWIEQLATENITSGCGTNLYCPDDPVTRAQMAVFLVKTFRLP